MFEEKRGKNAPATAGYGTDVKFEDFTKFLQETGEAITGSNKPREVTTGTQAHQVLSGNAPRLADTTRTPVGNTSNVQAHNILRQGPPRSSDNPVSPGTGSSSSATTTDLPQAIMSLATNIGTQATSTQELVDLMRRSIGIQDKILQQSRN